jgi:hypothetical protein
MKSGARFPSEANHAPSIRPHSWARGLSEQLSRGSRGLVTELLGLVTFQALASLSAGLTRARFERHRLYHDAGSLPSGDKPAFVGRSPLYHFENSGDSGSAPISLFQFRVLRFGLLQDGDVGVGVFPEGEEVFVGGEGADAGGVGSGRSFGLERIGTRCSQMR